MRVLFVGTIRRNGLMTVRALRRAGIDCAALVDKRHLSVLGSEDELAEAKDWLYTEYRSSRSALRRLTEQWHARELMQEFDLIHSRCLGLLFNRFGPTVARPFLEQSVGSDMREIGMGAGPGRERIRSHYLKARRVLVSQNDHLAICDDLGITNYSFMPLIVDTEFFQRCSTPDARTDGDLVIFHPTHHDWTYLRGDRSAAKGNDKRHRFTKGNDKLIRALARLIAMGCDARLVTSDRGVDIEESKSLVQELGIERHVEWLPPMTPAELRRRYSSADLVVDQFEIGTLGLISLEALSCGARVMVHLDQETATRAYGDLPPIINCRDEGEILQGLLATADIPRGKRNLDGRRWVVEKHGADIVCRLLKDHYEDVLGR